MSRKIKKILACLELCLDVLANAKNKQEAEAYQQIGRVMFDIENAVHTKKNLIFARKTDKNSKKRK